MAQNPITLVFVGQIESMKDGLDERQLKMLKAEVRWDITWE